MSVCVCVLPSLANKRIHSFILLTSAKEIMFSRLYANTDRHLTGSVYSAEVLTGVV